MEKKIVELEKRIRKLEEIINSTDYIQDKELMKVLYSKAKEIVIKHNKASVIFLQRKLMIDLERAEKLIKELEKKGVIGPERGFKPREVKL
jgi:S-DNA-T family DNA segregation ATPase FtsK/SpoIIIE